MTGTDKTYNGHTNYETWLVALWLDNDEYDQQHWRAAGEEAKQAAEICKQVRERVWEKDRAAVYILADRLKEEITEAAPEVTGMWADMITAALSEVDWHDVAEGFLEE